MYSVLDNELVVMIDCDDTLVMWDSPTIYSPGKLKLEFGGGEVYLTPHDYHIQLVKMYKERGYATIVWSANGKTHAERVVKVAGLSNFVDLIMTKPTKHMDDSTDPGSILGPRVYCPNFTKTYPSIRQQTPDGYKEMYINEEGKWVERDPNDNYCGAV